MPTQAGNASKKAEPGPGHNATGGIAADRLRSFVERIERLEEEKKNLVGDIKEVYLEAKGAGFDVKALRALIAMRKKEPQAMAEHIALLNLYRRAIGMEDLDL